jgi:hypothetical protein
VGGNLAASANGNVFLDFDESTYFRFVADAAPIKIDQGRLENLDLLAKLDVLADGHGCLPFV